MQSDYFTLSRGPLLFELAIEPLSVALRSSHLFHGVHWEGVEHCVSLYPPFTLCDKPHICNLHDTFNFGTFWLFFRLQTQFSQKQMFSN